MQGSIRSFFVPIIIMFTFSLLWMSPVKAESVTPLGSRPATQQDLEWMRWAGIPDPRVGMSVNPDDPNIGREIGEIKKWLKDHATRNAKIRCLNPEFARKLKTFMEATGAENGGQIPVITDAYRTEAEQMAIIGRRDGSTRVRTPCDSYHPWGLAADFNQNTSAQKDWMRLNATHNSMAILGDWDPNHFQSTRRGGQCGKCEADGPDGTLPPSTVSPSAGVANAFRSVFGLQQQPMLPPPPQPILPPQPPLPPQPLSTAQPIAAAFQPSTSLIPQAQTQTQTGSTAVTNTNTNVNTNTNTPLSVSERLYELAFGTGSNATSSSSMATSVPLVITGATAGTIAYVSGQQPQQLSSSSISGIPGATQQTFGPGTVVPQGQPSFTPAQTTLQQTLTTLKSALILLLEYLKPFSKTRLSSDEYDY